MRYEQCVLASPWRAGQARGETLFPVVCMLNVRTEVIENMKKELGDDASELDGYEDMREEDQARISKAWEDGAGVFDRSRLRILAYRP